MPDAENLNYLKVHASTNHYITCNLDQLSNSCVCLVNIAAFNCSRKVVSVCLITLILKSSEFHPHTVAVCFVRS